MEAGGRETVMTTVAVAVRSAYGRGSRRAVRWAVENLMHKADRLVLVHVMPTITSVPTPSGSSISIKALDSSVVEMYMQEMRAKIEETFLTYKLMYTTISVETLILEGDNPAFALIRYISDSRVASLVLGSSSSNYFARKPDNSDVSSIVLKFAPHTSKVFVVSAKNCITNSLNLGDTERLHEPKVFSEQEYSISSSSTKSNNDNNLSSLSSSHSQAQTAEFSSRNSVGAQETDHQVLEDNKTSINNEEVQSVCSTKAEQIDVKAEVENLRLELEATLSLYNQACEDLVRTQTQVDSLSSESIRKAQILNAAQEREQNLRDMAAAAKQKYLEAEGEVERAKKLLAAETYIRQISELDALKESVEKKRIVDELFSSDRRYRRYTRDDIETATNFFADSKMIGEGAYGKVYKCRLDHTLVAVKVMRPEASDKKEEFLREVEVLSQLRHPHIVLLVGACPESGCLVYEYMENGSLEDYILNSRRRPLPWTVRFRIAFEVACGLAFLHHSKPEPIVHRDLKPGNVLLDKYHVSKIGDVGLAKMIHDVVPDSITEYRDSIIAGTLFYMDPEYQRTGTLRPKSDLYSFGVIILQLLAARHPNGLIIKFEKAIKNGTFSNLLDTSIRNWPLAEAEELAQVALKCCKLRCRDRPDLDTEVLPILKRLSEFADSCSLTSRIRTQAPQHFYCPILQVMDLRTNAMQ
ncbi:U-box domain-containing protein 34 isoform X2 [Andrographis paniculata]|uniref:U-box domain-containing protein 34 isoform X2 n=1 Tax=Andrographis paniculata TaxID=175694 RepID=UPI0021E72336|nr:U-box domain-containing protein 34 isoform X2 [Andrographis paniculata]